MISYRVSLTPKTQRQKVERLEALIQQLPQVDCPIRNYFAPGLYAREMTIPAGTTITGAVHKRENLAVLSKGRLLLATENGPVEISAPHILTVKPGAKNAATALEDSVWTNFFATETTDLDALVEELTESTAAELIGGSQNKQLLQEKQSWHLDSQQAQ